MKKERKKETKKERKKEERKRGAGTNIIIKKYERKVQKLVRKE